LGSVLFGVAGDLDRRADKWLDAVAMFVAIGSLRLSIQLLSKVDTGEVRCESCHGSGKFEDKTWQFAFPQATRWVNSTAKAQGRHHIDGSMIQNAIKTAGERGWNRKAGNAACATPLLCDPSA